ncbi:mRNA cleavage and polyadenylation specificity factor complex subunit pta1 [Erysiphe necator]|nr:mRNA cleavage and polyadenylation specificity factor complex subunit pta1 [Erysiphe necator]
METPVLSVEQQIKQLGDARKLVLSDANYYPQIIQGILQIVSQAARVELRRWVSDFFAEAFASPAIPPPQKETLGLIVLETLKNLIENPQEDSAVVKSVLQTAASIYPHVFRWIINNSYDVPSWDRMLAIKTRIFRIWDTAAPGIQICCIKFAQRVVMVQTKGPEADPKRGDPFEVSLTMVSPNDILDPKNLEAEASGLLDRVLSVFQENLSDAILIDATLNSLSILICSRPQLSNKILSVILNFNPFKHIKIPISPKTQVVVKSLEKTTRQLLIHVLKRDPRHPLSARIQQYIERTAKLKAELLDERSHKRGPTEITDNNDPAKRQRLNAVAKVPPPVLHVPLLGAGTHTVAELFTITTDASLKVFDVAMLPEDLVVKMGIIILQRIDVETLNQAIEGIRQRYKALSLVPASKPENSNITPQAIEEDDDDYEPDFPAEDTEQILNKLESSTPSDFKPNIADMALGNFSLPTPPPVTYEEAVHVGHVTFSRVFSVMQTLDERGKKSRAGLNRLAASNFDRDAWITIITRLATRPTIGFEEDSIIKQETKSDSFSLSSIIRESLYVYIFEDFRKRIDIAVAWLCEEWYNDTLLSKHTSNTVLHYEKWVLRILDGFIPYLDGQDRALVIKFLGDVPSLSMEALSRIKGLCRDPATVNMALQSLLYLVAFRPPVRELVLDTVEEIWNTYEDARPMVVKLFAKWRPRLGEQLQNVTQKRTETVEIAVA